MPKFNWSKWHDSVKLNPTEDGIYEVRIYTPSNYSPYNMERKESSFIIEVDNGQIGIWDDASECFVWNFLASDRKILNIDNLQEWLGYEIYGWSGPHKFWRPCFKCDKPITPMDMYDGDEENPNIKYVLHSNDAVDLRTHGHYGSTVIDSMGDETLSILVCDPCIRKYGEKVMWWTNKIGEYGGYNYHTYAEGERRLTEWHKKEIDLMTSYGYEWRFYTREGKLTHKNDLDIDPNHSGWFHKDFVPKLTKVTYSDGSSGIRGLWENKWGYRDNKELYDKWNKLHKKIFTPNLSNEFLEEQSLKNEMERMGCKTIEELEKFNKEMDKSLVETIKDFEKDIKEEPIESTESS